MRNLLLVILAIIASYAGYDGYQRFSADKSEPSKANKSFTAKTNKSFAAGLNKKAAINFAGYHVTNLSGSVLPNEGTADEKLAILETYYRLKPDARFLNAITKVNEFFLQAPDKEKITYRFIHNMWEIRHGDKLLGMLPEYPDFPDYLALLQRHAAKLGTRYTVRLASNTNTFSDKPFYYHDLIPRLNDCGIRWQKLGYDQNCLDFSVHAYSAMTLQVIDKMQAFDDIYGQAVAMLTIAKSLGNGDYSEDEAIIADQMGYTAHSSVLLGMLPDNTPIKLYINRQTERLINLAVKPSSDDKTFFLALMSLAKKKEKIGFYRLLIGHPATNWAFILPVIKAELELGDFGIHATRGRLLQYLILLFTGDEQEWFNQAKQATIQVLLAISREDKNLLKKHEVELLQSMQAEEKNVVTRFEAAMNRIDQTQNTPFLPVSYVRAFFSSYFYSGLYIEADHYANKLASFPAAEEMLKKFAGVKGPIQQEFVSWYGNLIAAKKGQLKENDFFRNIESLPHLGPTPIINAFNANQNLFHFGAPDMRNAVKLIFNKFDTRPALLPIAADIASSQLYNLNLAEKLHTANAVLNLDRSSQKQLALLHRDPELLLASIELEDDYYGLNRALASTEVPEQKIKEIYQTGFRHYPKSWAITTNYVHYLQTTQNNPSQVIEALKNWITLNPPDNPNVNPFQVLYALRAIAESLNEMNQHEEALAVLQPAVESWQGGILIEYSKTLALLNRNKEADQWFRATLDRYPNHKRAMLEYCDFLWHQGRYAEAAELVKPRLANSDFYIDLAHKFALTFKGKANEAEQAFVAIIATHQTPFTLDSFLHSALFQTNSDIIEQLYPLIRNAGPGTMFIAIHRYKATKHNEGNAAALAQLKQIIPHSVLNQMSMPIYEEKQYDLLWDFIEQPLDKDYPEMVWLLRAAAYRLEGGTEQQKQALEDYYRQSAGRNRIIAMGQYLMGRLSREELLRYAEDDNKILCEAAYYIAVNYIAEKQFVEANRWLQLAIETAETKNREIAWATHQLYNWNKDYVSLNAIADELEVRKRRSEQEHEEQSPLPKAVTL